MEALTGEVAPFGIHTMIVEPGFFRIELLDPRFDYDEARAEVNAFWISMNGKQAGDAAPVRRSGRSALSYGSAPMYPSCRVGSASATAGPLGHGWAYPRT